MRTPLIAGAFLFSLAAYACGGGDAADATAEAPATTLPSRDPAPTQPTETTEEEPGKPGTIETPPVGGNEDGGTPTGGGDGGGTGPGTGDGGKGGTGDPGPSQCAGDSVKEVEGNDTPATATDIKGAKSFCGTLSSASDVDYFSFMLPPDAASISMGASWTRAGASITLSVDGQESDIGSPPFAPGKTYLFKVATKGKSALNYRVNVGFTK